jgi:hypothetical protein
VTFWWWIEPLACTGLVCLFFAVIICFMFWDTDYKAIPIICAILLLPLALAFLGAVAWMLCEIFWWIWHPYF